MTSPILLGPKGQPISSAQFARRPGPPQGELGVPWAGRNTGLQTRPRPLNGIQVDTSQLRMSDFRMMRDHYQINSSLNILTFTLHQLDWKLEGGEEKVRQHCEENLRDGWSRLVRALSQAFWAGYSPIGLQWKTDERTGKIVLDKYLDLIPEECSIHWKEVNGVTKPSQFPRPKVKVKIYDGIKQVGFPELDKRNTLWYPLLMENGDMYGRKLFIPAFQPWYFSMMIHLYANRYFERFGEPVPVGRAPYDDTITIGGREYQGNVLMMNLLDQQRSGGSVVLPNSKVVTRGANGATDVSFEYTMEYLESQMRGADFERHLMRLDEEISIALFTPVTMMRTPDSGGLNIGLTHNNSYLTQLNAIASDWSEYIDKYILTGMARYNFGDNVEVPRIRFKKLGAVDQETVRSLLSTLVGSDKVAVDIKELGQMAGLTLKELSEVSAPSGPQPSLAPGEKEKDTRVGRPEREEKPKGTDKVKIVANAHEVVDRMVSRVDTQVRKAIREERALDIDLGYQAQIERTVGGLAPGLYDRLYRFAGEMVKEGTSEDLRAGLRAIVEDAVERG